MAPASVAWAAPVAADSATAPAVENVAELELRNPSRFTRENEPIYLDYYDLGLNADDARVRHLAARTNAAVLPTQHVDRDGDGNDDALLVLVTLAATETRWVSIVADEQASQPAFEKLTQAEISHKVGGSWQPRRDQPRLKEYVGGTFKNVQTLTAPPGHTDHSQFIRYEGPGIESDKVGYRIYLDWRNGFDIFGKRVSSPVLQRVGQDGFESYHEMADWGMDILKVGESLGAGGFGYVERDKIRLASDVARRSVRIIENGNLLSTLGLGYEGWKVGKAAMDLDVMLSMTAGSRRVHAKLFTREPIAHFAIGVVKHPDTQLIRGATDITGKAYSYLGSWGKQSLAGDQLGMAVLFQRGTLVKELNDNANYAVQVAPTGRHLDYHFVAAWQGEPGGIQTKDEFVSYLDQEAQQLTMPVRQRLRTTLARRAKHFPITASSALDWARKLADSELERKTLWYRHEGWDENRGRKPHFEYDTAGLLPLAYHELAQVSPDPRYAEVLAEVTGSFVGEHGTIAQYRETDYNIDAVAPGRNLLRLFEATQQRKYKQAADILRRQLERQPKTSEGAFWHKQKYPYQVWLDGVYMGMPFLTRYSTLFEQGKSYDQVIREFEVARKHLRDPVTGLYYHAWDEMKQQPWADPTSGLSKHFWARGLGWFAMAVVDVLELLPAGDEQHRKPLLAIVSELGPALSKAQDRETATWWQILDRPGAPGNYRESSASAMFTYFFAKATRNGYLPASYASVAQKSFEGLVREFVNVHPDGKISMTHQCLVAGLGFGRDGSYEYYMSEPIHRNDPKGTGPFILAGVEVHRLLKGQLHRWAMPG